MSPVDTAPPPAGRQSRGAGTTGAARAISLLTLAGFAIALIGWIDVVFLAFPARPWSPEWEFGTITALFDGLPLGTLGIILIAWSALAAERRMLCRALSIFCWLVTLILLLLLAVYTLGLPVAFQGMQEPSMATVLRFTVVKAYILALTYVVFYALAGRLCWKAAAPRR